jgi:hypothetical protein
MSKPRTTTIDVRSTARTIKHRLRLAKTPPLNGIRLEHKLIFCNGLQLLSGTGRAKRWFFDIRGRVPQLSRGYAGNGQPCSGSFLLGRSRSRRCRVSVRAPSRVMEVKDEVSVVGSSGIVKCQRSNVPPTLERPPLAESRAVGVAIVGDFNIQRDLAFGHPTARVENLSHDLIAEIQAFTRNPWLIGRHEQAQKRRRSGRFAAGLPELRYFVELSKRWFPIDVIKDGARDEQNGQTTPAPPPARVRGIA